MSFSILNFWESLCAGIKYVPVTLKMAFVIFIWASIIGLIIATIRFYKIPILNQFFSGFVTVYLGVPMILAINVYYLIYITFYDSFVTLLNINSTIRDANYVLVAYFTMIIGLSCSISEIFRGAYKSIDDSQFEAGYSIGMTRFQTLRRIIIPQIIPTIVPSMLNTLTATIKHMSIVSIIGVNEIMNGALLPSFKTYSYVEGYLAAAMIYWFVNIIVERIGRIIEKNSVVYRTI